VTVDIALLRRVDRYLDAAPLGSAEPVDVGPLRAFVSSAPWPYYVRPLPDLDLTMASAVTSEEIRRAAALLERVNQSVSFEWVAELVPSLAGVLSDEGYVVRTHPLLVLDLSGSRPEGELGRLLGADDDVATSLRVSDLGFSEHGTAVGDAGTAERDATVVEDSLVEFVRERIRAQRSVVAVAEVEGAGVVATGWHQPVGEETEVVGVATVPAFRRRGAGAAVVRTLLEDAVRRGVTLALLSADDDAVARVYERVGFTRIGHTAAAERPT
jgi:GNAT superfamily N-acetyltransferase